MKYKIFFKLFFQVYESEKKKFGPNFLQGSFQLALNFFPLWNQLKNNFFFLNFFQVNRKINISEKVKQNCDVYFSVKIYI